MADAESELLTAQPQTGRNDPKGLAIAAQRDAAAVERVKEYIAAGDVFQTVLSQRFDVEPGVDSFQVYRALRAVNPSPYMYLFRLPAPDGSSYAVVGSSPEALGRVIGRSGRTAKALRTLVGALADGRRVRVDVVDD